MQTQKEWQIDMVRQINESKKTVQDLKKLTPGIFPAHGQLLEARLKFKNAQRELTRAEEAWKNLGK